jgi:outer membrane protein assembly factor BamD
MKKILAFCLIAVIGLAAAGCKSKKAQLTPEITSSDEALFKEAEKYVKKDPEKARLYLRQVIDSFPKSFFAQRAKLAVADSYFKEGDEGNMILAAAEYREFISLYPYSPSASYAQYRVGLCFYDKSLRAGRDPSKTLQAMAEFKKVLSQYPLSEEAKLARDRIANCEQRLAEHEYQIGYVYYRLGAYKAAKNRLMEILTNYPLYPGLDKVYYYLGDSFYKSGANAEAAPYLTKLVSDYPKSKLSVKAQKLLKQIEAAPKKPAPKKEVSR